MVKKLNKMKKVIIITMLIIGNLTLTGQSVGVSHVHLKNALESDKKVNVYEWSNARNININFNVYSELERNFPQEKKKNQLEVAGEFLAKTTFNVICGLLGTYLFLWLVFNG